MEATRLARSARTLVRFLPDGEMIAGHQLRKNTFVGMVSANLLWDKKLWGDDVDCFNPDRWRERYPDITGLNPKRYPMSAWGFGPRSCPGSKPALYVILAFMIAMFEEQYQLEINEATNPAISSIYAEPVLCRVSAEFRARVTAINQ